jgi:hypothetical protein
VKARLIDLFCGAGGATRGYQLAGFYVVGVDIEAQPNYVGDEFVQADALTYPLEGFDAVHASPPCQFYAPSTSAATKAMSPALINGTRLRLRGTDVPWVMENVMGAKRDLRASLLLCGSMFDMPISRHRLFESSEFMWAPHHPPCVGRPLPELADPDAAYRKAVGRRALNVTGHGRYKNSLSDWKKWMGMPWATRDREVTEAIPPAYTEWIGRQLLQVVEQAA